MRAVESLLRQRACPKINLQIRDGNASVMALYQVIGYRRGPVFSLGKRLEFDDSGQ